MSAHFKIHLPIRAVFHPVRLDQTIALQGVGHRQMKGKGIDRPGLLTVAQVEGNAGFAVLLHRKQGVPAEAVGGNGVGLTVQGVLSVFQPGDHREEQRGAAGPNIGVALPQILRAILGGDGSQLCAHIFNFHREPFIP